MTGRHTGHCTVRQNGQVLNSTDITIASILKKQGYQTALIGKWGLGKAPSYSSTVKASQSRGLHEHKQQQRELLSCVHTRSLTSRVSGNSINHRFLCACMKSGSVGIGQLSPQAPQTTLRPPMSPTLRALTSSSATTARRMPTTTTPTSCYITRLVPWQPANITCYIDVNQLYHFQVQ